MRRSFAAVLRNLLLVGGRRYDGLQEVSEGFWRDSTFTFLASDDYYERRTTVLAEVLDALGDVDSIIDVGCGDGRFTRMLARHARRTIGYDISPALVEKARMNALGGPESSVRYEVASLDDLPPSGHHDLVSCMGVFSCLINQDAWLRALEKCRSMVRPGGRILLVDTLAERREIVRAYRSGYVARYRKKRDYERAIVERGMTIEVTRPVARMSRHTTNVLYLIRR